MGSFLLLTIFLQRRFDEVDDDDTSSPPPAPGRSPSPLPPTERVLRTRNHAIQIEESIPWRMSPTVVLPPGQSSKPKPSRHNPFHNNSKGIRPTVTNVSSNLSRRKLFHSDWNLDHLREKGRKPESSLPFKVDTKGKPLVPVALGSRQRMSSRS